MIRLPAADAFSNGSMFGQPMQSGRNLETVYSTIVNVAVDAEINHPSQ
jgi:hypothetical protein